MAIFQLLRMHACVRACMHTWECVSAHSLLVCGAQALDHPLTLLLFTIMTLWALFCEEMRVAADFSKSTDIPFASISFAFMNLFFIEWALRSWVRMRRPLIVHSLIDEFSGAKSPIADFELMPRRCA
eukprot:1564664-Pleurochrysis_carterae.AAC.1